MNKLLLDFDRCFYPLQPLSQGIDSKDLDRKQLKEVSSQKYIVETEI